MRACAKKKKKQSPRIAGKSREGRKGKTLSPRQHGALRRSAQLAQGKTRVRPGRAPSGLQEKEKEGGRGRDSFLIRQGHERGNAKKYPSIGFSRKRSDRVQENADTYVKKNQLNPDPDRSGGETKGEKEVKRGLFSHGQ